MSRTLTFQVDDMTCGHCASTITKVVGSVDPDAKVAVDLAAHFVSIASDQAGSEAFGEAIREAIREAGYTPLPIERSPAD